MNKVKVFRHLPPCTPALIASSTLVVPFDFELITSSLPNAISLHLTNTALNELINSQQPLNSPAHKYVGQLTGTSERLQAQITTLQKENEEIQATFSKKKRVKKGKRMVIQGQIILSTFEMHHGVAESEREIAQAHRLKETKGKRSKRAPSPVSLSDEISDMSNNESQSDDESEMQDCIEVCQM